MSTETFYALTPDRLLHAVEVGGRRATGYALSLHSLENRVYEMELEDGERVVAKFYRPGRWSEAALREEHAFLRELADAELPAVAPLEIDGETLRTIEVEGTAIWCAVFPKVRGRPTEEPDDERLAILGRLLARLHDVGAARPALHRGRLDVEHYGRRPLEHALAVAPGGVRDRYRDVVLRLLDAIEPRLPAESIRVHADCHAGNLLWDGRGPLFLDFDDFTMGPPVQDVWLLVSGRDAEATQQRDLLVEAYETMRAFDRRTLSLIEPLRALRIIRYAGWIAARYDDPAFRRAFPDYTDDAYWQREIAALQGVEL